MESNKCQCCHQGSNINTEIMQGATGASAYEIAVEHGFVGTEEEWMDSLKGADGADGVSGQDGKDGVTPEIGISVETLPPEKEATVTKTGTLEAPCFSLGIPRGEQGPKGDPGPKGEAGDIPTVEAADIDLLF